MLLNIIRIYVSVYVLAVKAHFLPPHEIHNSVDDARELKTVIKSLNDIHEDIKANKDYDKIITGNIEELNDEEKEETLQKILWLIKKSYKAKTRHDYINAPLNSGARFYFIKNPEVIENYKKYLQGKTIESPIKIGFVIWRPSGKMYRIGAEAKRRAQLVRIKDFIKIGQAVSEYTSSYKNDRSENRKQTAKKKLQELRRQILFPINASKQRSGDINQRKNLNDKNLNEEGNFQKDLEDDKTVNSKEYIEEEGKRKVPIDSPQLHKERRDRDLRREKKWRDENSRVHWNTKRVDEKYDRNSKDINSWEAKGNRESGRVKHTTKDWEIDYKRKRLVPNDKISYGKSNSNFRGDFALYGRTAIPYVGKKGIFEDY